MMTVESARTPEAMVLAVVQAMEQELNGVLFLLQHRCQTKAYSLELTFVRS